MDKKSSGFTLIELIVVMAILRIIVAVADEVCPVGGVIRYEDGEINCNVNEDGSEDDEDEPPGDEVPWL